MSEDRVRARFRGYDAPEQEVEQTSFVGMTTPTVLPGAPAAPAPVTRRPVPPPAVPAPEPAAVDVPAEPVPAAPEVRHDVTPVIAQPTREQQLRALAALHGRKAAALAAVLAVLVGVPVAVHRHRVHVHEAKVAKVTALLEEAGRVQQIVHTYEGFYANEAQLVNYGFTLPAEGFRVATADRFDYCMTAQLDEVTLALRNGALVSSCRGR